MTQLLNFKQVQEIKPDERCLLELGARPQSEPNGFSTYYAVLKISRIAPGRYLLRVRGSDKQTVKLFVNSDARLAVVSQELYDTILDL